MPKGVSGQQPDLVAITGGAGQIAQLLRPRLAQPNRFIRLIDIHEITEPANGERIEAHRASITDIDALSKLFTGVRAVVHLAGQSYESDLDDILETNVRGTYCVLEAARRAGVAAVVLASSNHAAGFHPTQDTDGPLPAGAPGRPDTLYGWSKVAIEALGHLYADRYDIDITCVRIGSCTSAPADERSLALWLSPDDAARVVEASIRTRAPGYRLIWGISRNTRRYLSLAEGESIGYVPADDAEHYAPDILVTAGSSTGWVPGSSEKRIGGPWCATPLGQSNRP